MYELPLALAPELLAWYERSARPLPWRDHPDPYRVWLSEIMLQQTRIEAVRPYFERFLAAYPTLEALAAADEDAVMKQWEGLGYYSRARHLRETARILVTEHNGQFPQTASELRALPGIGDYTSGAIASIAFDRPEPAVDGNVLRLCARLTRCPDSVASAAVRACFREALRPLYPEGRCGAFTSALMELGETICLPGTPDCDRCPLAALCAAHTAGDETAYPVLPDKKPRRIEERTVLLLQCDGHTALRRRPEKGLLAGLWELPNIVGFACLDDITNFTETHRCTPLRIDPCEQTIHVFSHVEWHMRSYRILCAEQSPDFVWVPNLENHALPTAFRAWKKYIDSP